MDKISNRVVEMVESFQLKRLIVRMDAVVKTNLPREFQVRLRDTEVLLIDGAALATAKDIWARAKVELTRRGYIVWEFWDEEIGCFVAHCAKTREQCG